MTAAIKGRPAHETLESLRLTLLKVEQSLEPGQNAEGLAELKRILLQRIAELEAIEVIESAEAQIAIKSDLDKSDSAKSSPDQSDPAALVSPDSIAVDDSKTIATDADDDSPPPLKPN